jgi:hypothetical protein
VNHYKETSKTKGTFTTNELAGVLGITAMNVTELRRRGVFIRVGYNSYKAFESLRNYVRYKVEFGVQRFQRRSGDGARLLKANADKMQYAADKERWAAQTAEIAYLESAGTLVDWKQLHADITARDKILQKKMRAIASNLSAELGDKDSATIQNRILDEIDAVLRDYADPDNAEDFYATYIEE